LPVLELELERENDPALKDAKDENLVGLSFWGSSSCSSLAGNFPALRLVVLADLFFEVALALDRLVLVVDSSSSLLSLLLFVLSILDDRPVGLILKLPILAFCSRRVDLLVVPGTLVLIRVTGVSVISLGWTFSSTTDLGGGPATTGTLGVAATLGVDRVLLGVDRRGRLASPPPSTTISFILGVLADFNMELLSSDLIDAAVLALVSVSSDPNSNVFNPASLGVLN